MSILSDADIIDAYRFGKLGIEPYNDANIQPASYDVTLANDFILYTKPNSTNNSEIIYPNESNVHMTKHFEVANTFALGPKQFVLGSTIERVKIPDNLVCRVEGKSSLARLGLIVHTTAGFVDSGFEGNITLEFFNVNNRTIMLTAGMKIAQLSFEELKNPAAKPYGSHGLGSKYQNSSGTVGAK